MGSPPKVADSVALARVPELADRALKRARVKVIGLSMRPALNDGDHVQVEPTKGGAPGVGEVVLYLKGRTWVCHRVTRVENGRVFTKGDALDHEDEPVAPEAIVARVTAVERATPGRARLKRAAAAALESAQGFSLFRGFSRELWRRKPEIFLSLPFSPQSRFRERHSLKDARGLLESRPETREIFLIIGPPERPEASLELKRLDGGEWRVMELSARLRRRGQGLGSSLLKEAVSLARATGACLLSAELHSGRRAAIGAFRKAGFREYASYSDRTLFLHSSARETPAFSPYRKVYEGTSVEEKLLAASCSAGAPGVEEELDLLLRGPLDWWTILFLARQHNVSALLYVRLRGLGPSRVPATALEALRQAYYRNAAQHARASAALRPFLEEMNRRGHKLVVLQGAALAQHVYKNPALRPMGDADFLIAPQAFATAEEILTRLGFTRETYGQYALREGANPPVAVELHVPEDYAYLNMSSLRERAAPAPSELFARPQSEDLLVFLALHMSLHHAWFRLIWLSDLARILAAEKQFDWDRALSLVKAPLRRWALLSVLKSCAELLKAPLPPRILSELDSRPRSARAFLLDRLWGSPPVTGAGFLALDVLSPPLENIAPALNKRLWPSAEFMRRRYGVSGARTLALYYPLRLAGLGYSALGLARRLWTTYSPMARSR